MVAVAKSVDRTPYCSQLFESATWSLSSIQGRQYADLFPDENCFTLYAKISAADVSALGGSEFALLTSCKFDNDHPLRIKFAEDEQVAITDVFVFQNKDKDENNFGESIQIDVRDKMAVESKLPSTKCNMSSSLRPASKLADDNVDGQYLIFSCGAKTAPLAAASKEGNENKRYVTELSVGCSQSATMRIFDDAESNPWLIVRLNNANTARGDVASSVPKCRVPRDVSNGRLVHSSDTYDQAVFQCNEGFQLSTDGTTARCLNGHWTHNEPKCVPVTPANPTFSSDWRIVDVVVLAVSAAVLLCIGITSLLFLWRKRKALTNYQNILVEKSNSSDNDSSHSSLLNSSSSVKREHTLLAPASREALSDDESPLIKEPSLSAIKGDYIVPEPMKCRPSANTASHEKDNHYAAVVEIGNRMLNVTKPPSAASDHGS